MLLAAHSITGGFIGSQVGSLPLAFLLGLMSHFLLDAVPHYDTTDDGKFTKSQLILLVTDAIIGFIILFHIYTVHGITISYIWGIIGGVTPDLLDNVPFWRDRFRRTAFGSMWHNTHTYVHQKQPGMLIGFATQAIVIVFFYFLSLYF